MPPSDPSVDRTPNDPSARIEAAVLRFEEAWQQGPCPRLEDYLALATSLVRCGTINAQDCARAYVFGV